MFTCWASITALEATRRKLHPVTMIEDILSQLLDRLGRGWKTTLGLFLMAAMSLAITMKWIPEDKGLMWLGWATVVFGIGLYHKSTRSEPPPSQPKT